MPETIGPAIHSITDGRLTFKKPHLEYLENPTSVDITLGPGKSILIHNPAKRQRLVDELLGGDDGVLDSNQRRVAMRLDNMADSASIDEQGRIRIPALYLKRAGLVEKTVKAYLVPARREGWLELYDEAAFEAMLSASTDDEDDAWSEALDAVIRAQRKREAEH